MSTGFLQKKKGAAVGPDIPIQAVEEGGLAGAIAAQQAIDFSLLEGNVMSLKTSFDSKCFERWSMTNFILISLLFDGSILLDAKTLGAGFKHKVHFSLWLENTNGS